MTYEPTTRAVDVLLAFLCIGLGDLRPREIGQRALTRAIDHELSEGRLINPDDIGVGPWHVQTIIDEQGVLGGAYQVVGPRVVAASWLTLSQATAVAATLNAVGLQEA